MTELCSLTHFPLLAQLEEVLAKLRAILGALVVASCVDSRHLVATDGTPNRISAAPTDQRGAAGSGSGNEDNGGASSGIQGWPSVIRGPAGVGPLPTPAQVAYQRGELTAFVHFGLGTYDGTEFGDTSSCQGSGHAIAAKELVQT